MKNNFHDTTGFIQATEIIIYIRFHKFTNFEKHTHTLPHTAINLSYIASNISTGELQGDVRTCRTAAIGILNKLNPFRNFDSSSCNSIAPRPSSIQNLSDSYGQKEEDTQESKRKRSAMYGNYGASERRIGDIGYNLDEKEIVDYNTYSGEHAEEVLKGGHIPFDFEKKNNNDHVGVMKDDDCDKSEKTTDNEIQSECDKNQDMKIWTNMKSDGNVIKNGEKNITNNNNKNMTEKEDEMKDKESMNNHDMTQKPFIPLASPVVRGLGQQRKQFSISQCNLSSGEMMTPDIYYLEMYKTMSDSVRVGTYVSYFIFSYRIFEFIISYPFCCIVSHCTVLSCVMLCCVV